MTDQEKDLYEWGLQHYFVMIPRAVDEAKKILIEKGMESAVEHLVKICAHNCIVCGRPGVLRYETRRGKVQLWKAEGDRYHRPPDLEVDLEEFCRAKLQSLYQAKML